MKKKGGEVMQTRVKKGLELVRSIRPTENSGRTEKLKVGMFLRPEWQKGF